MSGPQSRRLPGRTTDTKAAAPTADPPGLPHDARSICAEALAARSGLVLAAAPHIAVAGALLRAARAGLRDRKIVEIPSAIGLDNLRTAMREDPDVVLAGEIGARDAAAALIEAAADGRLVLAAVTACSAAAAIGRLRALRIEPFEIACSLRAAIARRTVRRLCPACRQPVQAGGSAAALLGFDPGTILYEARGCHACGGSGFRGRIALFEAISADPAMRRLINGGGDAALIANYAFRNAPDLGAVARMLARRGETSPAEAARISRGAEG